MEREERQRYEQLYQQIIEIASGNFGYRQKLSGKRDYLDTLAELLNMMSEEVANFSFELEERAPSSSIPAQLLFDEQLNVHGYTKDLCRALGLEWIEVGINLMSLVPDHCMKILSKKIKRLNNGGLRSSDSFYLDFLTPSGLYLRAPCKLKKLVGGTGASMLLLSVFIQTDQGSEIVVKRFPTVNISKSKTMSSANRLLTRQVRLYVLRNLNTSLPSLRQIGLIHRTNQTKLKEEFKKAYGTTIHRFHNQRRLEKAALLLKTTELPISDVFRKCGFKDASHFSRKFKERFGRAPTNYRADN